MIEPHPDHRVQIRQRDDFAGMLRAPQQFQRLQSIEKIAARHRLGLAGAFVATRLLNSLLFGVGASDPVTFAAIVLLVSVVSFIAAWVPARRATRVDPIIALRAE